MLYNRLKSKYIHNLKIFSKISKTRTIQLHNVHYKSVFDIVALFEVLTYADSTDLAWSMCHPSGRTPRCFPPGPSPPRTPGSASSPPPWRSGRSSWNFPHTRVRHSPLITKQAGKNNQFLKLLNSYELTLINNI